MNTKVFTDARIRFADALSYYVAPGEEISYAIWLTIPESLKAAALYVQFYPEIMTALVKSTSEYIPDEDLLSFLLQYLQKNVDKMTIKKYNGAYIYRIAYNCMAAPRRNVVPQKRFAVEVPQYCVTADGEQLDRFDTCVDSEYSDIADAIADKEFWSIIQNATPEVREVIYSLLGRTKLPKYIKKKQKIEIIKQLRRTFIKFRPQYCDDNTMRFYSVINAGDYVESAVVEMANGDLTVYYGENEELHGVTYYKFFGAKRDYFVPFDAAIDLKVMDVQLY